MKLYLYDEKHEQIHAALDLGDLSPDQTALLQNVINFLGAYDITDRYKRLILAHSYLQEYPDGESQITFQTKG